MTRAQVVRPFIEKVLKDLLELKEIEPDEDGDYCFRYGNAAMCASLLEEDPPVFRLSCVMLESVKSTPKLLATLNEINAEVPFGRVFWAEDRIVVVRELLAEALDEQQIEHSCVVVGEIADHYDASLKKRFGGKMTFPHDDEKDDDEEDEVDV